MSGRQKTWVFCLDRTVAALNYLISPNSPRPSEAGKSECICVHKSAPRNLRIIRFKSKLIKWLLEIKIYLQ